MQSKKSLLYSPGAWICRIFDHRYKVSQNITDHIREYKCTRCGVEMTDTAQGFMTRLTPKFRETNEFLANYYKRRCSHLKYRKQIFSKAS